MSRDATKPLLRLYERGPPQTTSPPHRPGKGEGRREGEDGRGYEVSFRNQSNGATILVLMSPIVIFDPVPKGVKIGRPLWQSKVAKLI